MEWTRSGHQVRFSFVLVIEVVVAVEEVRPLVLTLALCLSQRDTQTPTVKKDSPRQK